ncbi:hypothetical protein [Pediococcus pentosaceus]
MTTALINVVKAVTPAIIENVAKHIDVKYPINVAMMKATPT